ISATLFSTWLKTRSWPRTPTTIMTASRMPTTSMRFLIKVTVSNWPSASKLCGFNFMQSRFLLIVFLLVFFSVPVYADITTGLVGWWKLTDGAGTSAADSSGGGHTGTLVNSPSWVVGKIWPFALSFNGANQYVNLNYSFPVGTALSYSAWIKSTTGGWYVVG